MNVILTERSYFTFRGTPCYALDLYGTTSLKRMQEEFCDDLPGEGKIELDPVFPFLTREELFTFAEEREGSFSFLGGSVIRGGCPLSETAYRPVSPGGGLFSLADYAAALARAIRESANRHLAAGALVEEGAVVSFSAKLEQGAVVRRGARVLGESYVGENAEIGPGSELLESAVGANTVVSASFLNKSVVGADCTVGPNTYLRPGSVVADSCRIGDFVELKNARIGRGSKVSHLAYVGDAEVGEKVNVGCGVVFANYDGRKKSRIKVGNGCFLGSNCNLIAPLTIGDGAFLAAGTTLTQDLSEEDFCVGRCRETIKPHRGRNYYAP